MNFRMITPPLGPVKRLVKVTMPTSGLGRFILVSYFHLLRLRQGPPWLSRRRPLGESKEKIKRFGVPSSNEKQTVVF